MGRGGGGGGEGGGKEFEGGGGGESGGSGRKGREYGLAEHRKSDNEGERRGWREDRKGRIEVGGGGGGGKERRGTGGKG